MWFRRLGRHGALALAGRTRSQPRLCSNVPPGGREGGAAAGKQREFGQSLVPNRASRACCRVQARPRAWCPVHSLAAYILVPGSRIAWCTVARPALAGSARVHFQINAGKGSLVKEQQLAWAGCRLVCCNVLGSFATFCCGRLGAWAPKFCQDSSH